jgi:hypothetical protein
VTYRGVIKGGVVVLEDGTNLPEGTPVQVYPMVPPGVPPASTEEKLAILKRWFSMNLPVADWEQMEDEIIRGAIEE